MNKTTRICSIPDCERKHFAKDLCNMHYRRLWRHGSTDSLNRTTCTIQGCDLKHEAKGFCIMHYQRFRRTGDPGPAQPIDAPPGTLCDREGCHIPTAYVGPCYLHRFGWTQRLVVPELGPCWEFNGAKDRSGYAKISIPGVRGPRRTARIILGLDEPDTLACHRCDNPPCIRREHLFAGTPQDNSDDAVSKGRNTRGEAVHSHKLTERDVVSIRERYATGVLTLAQLGREYGVTDSAIRYAVIRRTWKHVL